MQIRPHIATCLAALLLAACAATPPAGTRLTESGYVTDMRDIAVSGEQSSGVASFAGSILGGLVGSTIGSGSGRFAATVGGAVAGTVAGDHVARSTANTSTMTSVTVRMHNGVQRVFNVEPDTRLRVGDRVTVGFQDGVGYLVR